MAPWLLLIEDNEDIARVMQMDLGDAGFEVLHAPLGAAGVRLAQRHPFDLVLLDLTLPDLDGQDVIRQLRETSGVPIIVLTARDAVHEKVHLLDLGADDYLTKPCHPDELLARIQVQLRQRASETLTLGALQLEVQRRAARYAGAALHLTSTEFELLVALARQAGAVVTREALLDAGWAGLVPDGRNILEVHLSNLRGKLRRHGAGGLVRTVRGVGYVLTDEPDDRSTEGEQDAQ